MQSAGDITLPGCKLKTSITIRTEGDAHHFAPVAWHAAGHVSAGTNRAALQSAFGKPLCRFRKPATGIADGWAALRQVPQKPAPAFYVFYFARRRSNAGANGFAAIAKLQLRKRARRGGCAII